MIEPGARPRSRLHVTKPYDATQYFFAKIGVALGSAWSVRIFSTASGCASATRLGRAICDLADSRIARSRSGSLRAHREVAGRDRKASRKVREPRKRALDESKTRVVIRQHRWDSSVRIRAARVHRPVARVRGSGVQRLESVPLPRRAGHRGAFSAIGQAIRPTPERVHAEADLELSGVH